MRAEICLSTGIKMTIEATEKEVRRLSNALERGEAIQVSGVTFNPRHIVYIAELDGEPESRPPLPPTRPPSDPLGPVRGR